MLPAIMPEIRYYIGSGGHQPFAEWFAELEPIARARVTRAILRLGQGNFSNVKPVGEGVLEYRIDSSATSRPPMSIGEPIDRANAVSAERRREMAKAKRFNGLVQQHVKTDKKFAEALLREGIDAMLGGDVDTGKTILRDYIKATVGFETLGKATGAPPKSLIRMFGPRGNPQAKNLFNVIGYLQRRAGVRLRVAA
jgi:hypothetical protein